MTKALLLFITIVVLVWLLRRALSARKRGPQTRATETAPAPELVACAHCGVHLPRNEAFARPETQPAEARFFCSEDHLRLGPK
jgi:uncharacterized protein